MGEAALVLLVVPATPTKVTAPEIQTIVRVAEGNRTAGNHAPAGAPVPAWPAASTIGLVTVTPLTAAVNAGLVATPLPFASTARLPRPKGPALPNVLLAEIANVPSKTAVLMLPA